MKPDDLARMAEAQAAQRRRTRIFAAAIAGALLLDLWGPHLSGIALLSIVGIYLL